MKKNTDIGLLVLRVGIGLLILLHGMMKLNTGVAGISQQLVTIGLPSFLGYGVYVAEIIVPVFIILGVGTRWAAAILAVNCIAAIFLLSTIDGSYDITGLGWMTKLLSLYLLSALALIFTGGGKYILAKKKQAD